MILEERRTVHQHKPATMPNAAATRRVPNASPPPSFANDKLRKPLRSIFGDSTL
jgi:hypothetical protein